MSAHFGEEANRENSLGTVVYLIVFSIVAVWAIIGLDTIFPIDDSIDRKDVGIDECIYIQGIENAESPGYRGLDPGPASIVKIADGWAGRHPESYVCQR